MAPHFIAAYANRGGAYMEMAKRALARKDYAKAIRMYSKAIPNFRMMQRVVKKAMAFPILRNMMIAITKSMPTIGFYKDKIELIYLRRGIARIKAKQYAQAIRDFKVVLKMDPTSFLARHFIKKYSPCVRNPRICRP
jgi:tetratricopeptide (TPR) repeat protein